MRLFCLALLLLLYLALAFYQLGLPGLHYDEAREAGLNAMQILTGAPVTAFRESGLSWGGRTFPLMVQDYIGALNVYLSLPMLALSGIGVPNLRVLPILCGLLTLLLLERAVSTWVVWHDSQEGRPIPVTLEGLVAVALVAGSPSFVFWSRQGIFVTNLTQVWVALMLWQGICWLRSGEARPLRWAALAAGLALYAKLLAVWVVAPLGLLLLWGRLASSQSTVRQLGRALPGALAAFLFPLLPLFWFNLQSGGTLAALGDNLTHSYYGVDNLAVGVNLIARLAQFVQVLRGDQFWYLGTVLANPVAPWVALVVAGAGAWRAPFWTTRTTSICCTALPPQSSRGEPTTFLQWPELRGGPLCWNVDLSSGMEPPSTRSGKCIHEPSRLKAGEFVGAFDKAVGTDRRAETLRRSSRIVRG